MAKKTWAQLTPAYRARLERAGITQSLHANGVKLTAARGHAQYRKQLEKRGDFTRIPGYVNLTPRQQANKARQYLFEEQRKATALVYRIDAEKTGVQFVVPGWDTLSDSEKDYLSEKWVMGFMTPGVATDASIDARMDFIARMEDRYGGFDREDWQTFKTEYNSKF